MGRDDRRPAGGGARARPRLREPAVAGGRGCLADQPRAPARLRREGDARGGGPHHVDRAGRVVRERRARPRRRGLRRPGGGRVGRGRRRAAGRPGLEQRAVGQAC
ncbi:hypothetical protein [Nocardioides convexus]|uniref:hypothetical protein n=1 Tax=Nocardioides convexus TaxID=2712224 RepID=UPI0024185E0C|nr:hypothetical protein [Nocardioides convexus]